MAFHGRIEEMRWGFRSYEAWPIRATLVCGAALALVALGRPAAAADWNIVLNGKAIHVNANRDWNEDNWGLGFERESGAESRWVKVTLANGFKDSANEMSYMAGAGIKRRFPFPPSNGDLYFDVGLAGFLMTREDVRDNRPFPGMLPTMTVGVERFAINLSYVPAAFAEAVTNIRQADPSISGIFFFQFKIAPKMFAPDRSRRASN
jgi:hypothetical protein